MRRLVIAALTCVALAGTPASVAARPSLKLTSLNFGVQPVGSSTSGVVTVTSREPVPLTLSSLSLFGETGGFAIAGSSGGCRELVLSGAPLAPGGSCGETVDFSPSTAGSFHATFCVDAASASYCARLRGRGAG